MRFYLSFLGDDIFRTLERIQSNPTYFKTLILINIYKNIFHYLAYTLNHECYLKIRIFKLIYNLKNVQGIDHLEFVQDALGNQNIKAMVSSLDESVAFSNIIHPQVYVKSEYHIKAMISSLDESVAFFNIIHPQINQNMSYAITYHNG